MVRKKRRCTKRNSDGGKEPLRNQTDLKALLDTPPWDWPRDAGKTFHKILTDSDSNGSDRLIAAQLAGDFTVINDALSDALMEIVSSAHEPKALRAAAAISLGPVLEHADTSGFEDADGAPITEHSFRRIQLALHKLYLDESVPVEGRRRILEASVRAPCNWHRDAISLAYSSGDRDWMLTAVFSMRWVRGFDDRILEALNSSDCEIHREALYAAGNWELNAARDHIVALIRDGATPKPLRLAAISAVASIGAEEAREILTDLTDSEDQEIAEAADEAIASVITEGGSDDADDEEDASDWIN